VVFIPVRAGSLTAGQIGRELSVGVSTVTGLVDRLAEQGLVSRGEDPHDRRATRVVPTDDGRALVERLYAFRRETLRSLLEHVPTARLQELASGLEGVELATHERLRPIGGIATPEDTH
jgi:DNA-binding MarR family transcriptional regulator